MENEEQQDCFQRYWRREEKSYMYWERERREDRKGERERGRERERERDSESSTLFSAKLAGWYHGNYFCWEPRYVDSGSLGRLPQKQVENLPMEPGLLGVFSHAAEIMWLASHSPQGALNQPKVDTLQRNYLSSNFIHLKEEGIAHHPRSFWTLLEYHIRFRGRSPGKVPLCDQRELLLWRLSCWRNSWILSLG